MKLVLHFYDFSTIYYKFPNIQPITNINKILKKEEKTLGPEVAQLTWSSEQSSPGGGWVRRRERPKRG